MTHTPINTNRVKPPFELELVSAMASSSRNMLEAMLKMNSEINRQYAILTALDAYCMAVSSSRDGLISASVAEAASEAWMLMKEAGRQVQPLKPWEFSEHAG